MIHQDVWCFFLGTVFWHKAGIHFRDLLGLIPVISCDIYGVPTVPSRWDHRVRRRNNENLRFCAKRNNDWKWPWCSFGEKMGDLTFKSAKWMQMDPNGSISGPKLKPLRVMLILESNSDTCFGSLLNLVFYSADIWFGRGVVMQRICNKTNKDFSFCLGKQLAFHRFHNPRGIHEKKAATVLVYRVGLKFRDTTKCMLWVVMGKLWTHSKPWDFRVLYFQTIWNHQSFKMHFSQVRRMMPRRDSDARACRKQNRTLWMDLSDLRSLCQGVAMPPHQQHQMHPHWTSKVACCALKSLLFSCNWVMQWNLQICLIISMFQTSNHRNLGVPNSTLTHFWCEFQSWT